MRVAVCSPTLTFSLLFGSCPLQSFCAHLSSCRNTAAPCGGNAFDFVNGTSTSSLIAIQNGIESQWNVTKLTGELQSVSVLVLVGKRASLPNHHRIVVVAEREHHFDACSSEMTLWSLLMYVVYYFNGCLLKLSTKMHIDKLIFLRALKREATHDVISQGTKIFADRVI
jgi:hypothetical protein